ncbi:MAG TPA: amidohydrolase family protein, partial [Myxococcota bacterium]
VDDIIYETDQFEIYSELEQEGLLPIRVTISPLIELSPGVAGDLDLYASWREKLTGHRLLKFGFLKGFVDGVIESKTAYMTAPYEHTTAEVGRPLIPRERLFKLVDDAHKRGFQVALHSIGDGAVRLSLDAFEAAAKRYRNMPIRHRVEHIELLHVDDVKRFKALNVVASMQPYHVNPFGDEPQKGPWAENLGDKRWPMTMPWRSIVDAGGAVTFGSDWPVYTANPLHGLAVAVSRRDEEGRPKEGWNAQQAVSVVEGLRAYTIERGEIRGPSSSIGALAPGQKADVVVLDPAVQLDDVRTWWPGKVATTIVDGDRVVLP